MALFDTYAGGLREILSVVLIGDGSYEIVVLDSHCDTLRSRLNEFLPNSKFELNYDPAQPTELTWQLGSMNKQRPYVKNGFFREPCARLVKAGPLQLRTTLTAWSCSVGAIALLRTSTAILSPIDHRSLHLGVSFRARKRRSVLFGFVGWEVHHGLISGD